jgi:hypothetical protein
MSKPAVTFVLKFANQWNDGADQPTILRQHKQSQETRDLQAVRLSQAPA